MGKVWRQAERSARLPFAAPALFAASNCFQASGTESANLTSELDWLSFHPLAVIATYPQYDRVVRPDRNAQSASLMRTWPLGRGLHSPSEHMRLTITSSPVISVRPSCFFFLKSRVLPRHAKRFTLVVELAQNMHLTHDAFQIIEGYPSTHAYHSSPSSQARSPADHFHSPRSVSMWSNKSKVASDLISAESNLPCKTSAI